MRKMEKRAEEVVLKIVNHDAWIECNKRAYLKWGHYPETDGKLDPQNIKRAIVIDPKGERMAIVGTDKDATSKGGLFLEFNAEEPYLVGAEYDRGIYSVTEDGKWVFGEKKFVANMGYKIEESRWLIGFAKAYVAREETKPALARFEFEIVPDAIKQFKAGDKIRILLLFRGKAVEGKVKVRSGEEIKEFSVKDSVEIELSKGVNVISSRYEDETPIPGVCDKRNLASTLTVIAEG